MSWVLLIALQIATGTQATPNAEVASRPYVTCLHEGIDQDPGRNRPELREAIFQAAVAGCSTEKSKAARTIGAIVLDNSSSEAVRTDYAQAYLNGLEELILGAYPFADSEKPKDETSINVED